MSKDKSDSFLKQRMYYPERNLSFVTSSADLSAYSTPLKKLSNNSLCDVNLGSRRNEDIIGLTSAPNTNATKRFTPAESEADTRVEDQSLLMPLSSSTLRVFQTDAINKSHQKHRHYWQPLGKTENDKISEPIYYRPPSSEDSGAYGGLLPPKLKRTIPIIHDSDFYPTTEASNDTISNSKAVEDPDDFVDDSTHGDWINPVVREALQRQKNSEREAKRLVINILYALIVKLLLSFFKYLTFLFEASSIPSGLSTIYWSLQENHLTETIIFYVEVCLKFLYALFGMNCVISIYHLASKRDQCYDLPLTKKQRRLLGLNPVQDSQGSQDSQEELSTYNDAELITKRRKRDLLSKTSEHFPKYAKSNSKTHNMFVALPHGNIEKFRDPHDLTLANMLSKQNGSGSSNSPKDLALTQRNMEVEADFAKNYNLIFNCSDHT